MADRSARAVVAAPPGRGRPVSAGTPKAQDVVQDLGWGRLVFGNTFTDHERLGELLRDEATGRRDCCVYLPDAHVFIARHPQEFFIDPSLTYRLDLTAAEAYAEPSAALQIRPARDRADLAEMNAIYGRCQMVTADLDRMASHLTETPQVHYLVAVDTSDDRVIGTVTGVDHQSLFGDPEAGSSLWCLAVDPNASIPGVGVALVRALVRDFAERGLRRMDLSVLHDNAGAIELYERMGFVKVPELVVKRKNAINEQLFSGGPPEDLDALNPYARIIADEALRRGVRVTVLDGSTGYLQLEYGGRTVITRESLSQYTSAVAMSRCDDKRVSRTVVGEAGIRVPRGKVADFDESDHEFLAEIGTAVVKPVRGEQGAGITVRVTTGEQLDTALSRAGGAGAEVLIEEHVEGQDLRVVVIDGKVVAAAVRKPAEVVGTGDRSVRELIEVHSRRRSRASGGESKIPLDELTTVTVREEGWELDEVPPAGERILVRRTANLHTGGTIHDVTDQVSPALKEAAVAAAQAIGIPVSGIDLLVPEVGGDEYVFIEANERPGLANHEPQPVVQAFLDYLFPASAARR
ncbi:N-acetylglutaminylglutamine synthetase [Naumannella sp. ID2617S]|nr:N-acetylglutaminylglutamine synthetase [Naumannella sp. ID2617S]